MEFALILPILLFVMMGIVDFGRVLFTFAESSNSLRRALRHGVIPGYSSLKDQYLDCDMMATVATSSSFASATDVKIEYVKADGSGSISCPGTGSVTADQLENGDLLSIEVSATVNLITPIVGTLYPTVDFTMKGERSIIKDVNLGW